MIQSRHDYEEIYKQRSWAYSDKPDPQLIEALVGVPRGKVLDLAGGQGRHSIALSALGFDVLLVDAAQTGLDQASQTASRQGLSLRVLEADLATWVPDSDVAVAVAALFFHIPPRRISLEIAERVGEALIPEGLFYFSFPGFDQETQRFAEALIQSSKTKKQWIVKHLVTKKDRPRLSVPRRNETRVLAKR